MNDILDYLTRTYLPHAILVYGSFADGTNGAESDFDALVLTDAHTLKFDNGIVNGTPLDVYLYPPDVFEKPFDPDAFLQIFDGNILFDKTNTLQKAKETVLLHMKNAPKKSKEALAHDLFWCEKMCARAKRGDTEGAFRHHLVLTESLAIYSDLIGKTYLGPKKTLHRMKEADPVSFRLYHEALSTFDLKSLDAWVEHLRKLNVVQQH